MLDAESERKFILANPELAGNVVDPKKGSTPTGPTVTNTFYSGSGANRMKVEVLSDGTTRQTAAPEGVLNTGSGTKTSAYADLLATFNQYGLGALVEPLKGLITDNTSESELTLKLRQTEPYKKRFAANASRTANGLSALSEGAYIALEDQYQKIMRNYGLPESYYAKGELGRQEGFEKFIAGDVSATELEDRIMTAQNRVVNADPNIKEALKQFYPDIKDADILAYTLDPTKGLDEIKRKVTAAEIGGAQLGAGLQATSSNAEALARAGITGAKYQAKATDIAEATLRGGQLSAIYGQGPYTQQMAEQAQLNTPGSVEALKKTKKIAGLEAAEFGGRSGTIAGALSRDRAGSF